MLDEGDKVMEATAKTVVDIFNYADADENGVMDFNEFKNIMQTYAANSLERIE